MRIPQPDRLSIILTGLAAILFLVALYHVFIGAPTEKTMGDIQRIFYIHLPSAFISFLAFFVVFLMSLLYLLTRKPHWDWAAVSAAEVGVISCAVVLTTGPLWAKPVWGVWWTWDARLTSTLVLFLIYVSYLMLRLYVEDETRRATLAAVVGILGFVDVPLVYVANRVFRTQHPQPVIAGGEDSGLDPRMWVAVLWTFAALLTWSVFLFLLRYRLEKNRSALLELSRHYRV